MDRPLCGCVKTAANSDQVTTVEQLLQRSTGCTDLS